MGKLGDKFRFLYESLSGEEEEAGEREGELFRSVNWVITSGGGAVGPAITAAKSGDFATGLELAGGEMLREIDPIGELELFEPNDELELQLLASKLAAGTAVKPCREADPELPLGE